MGKRTQPAETESDQLIYVGPTVSKIGLQQFAVFRGGIPVYIDSAVKDCSDLAELFVPIEQLNQSRRDIDRQGSVMRQRYMNVRSFFNNR